MANSRLNDMVRQFAVLFTAISQIYFSYTVGREVGSVAQANRSLILPATYAFSIWGAIFLLCLLYAVYQALPAQRMSPTFRAMGWWSAGAFACNSVWNQIFISGQFMLSQVVIFCGLLCAAMAYFRYVQTTTPRLVASVDTWVIAPAVGLLFGWLTAANVVGLASVLVANGFSSNGKGAEIAGGALLVVGSIAAFLVVVCSRTGPSSAWIAYGAAVIWALVAVFLEQRSASMLIGLTSMAGMVLVVVALISPWNGRPRSRLPTSA